MATWSLIVLGAALLLYGLTHEEHRWAAALWIVSCSAAVGAGIAVLGRCLST